MMSKESLEFTYLAREKRIIVITSCYATKKFQRKLLFPGFEQLFSNVCNSKKKKFKTM